MLTDAAESPGKTRWARPACGSLPSGRYARLILAVHVDDHDVLCIRPLVLPRCPSDHQTRPTAATIDGVGVVAILQKASGPEILLQKQFRPPIGKVCIEIPAGLLDAGETAAQCAVRELKEETGYVGEVVEEQDAELGGMFNGEWE